MNKEFAVSLKDVNVSFGFFNVLSDITVNFPSSEMTAIIGPNGGGKTTLLKVITGLIKADTGSIQIFEKDVDWAREQGWIGYVPQAAQFDRNFPIRVEEVILSGTLKTHLRPFKRYSEEDNHKTNLV